MQILKKACHREGKTTCQYLPHNSTTIIEGRDNTSQDIASQLQSSRSDYFGDPLHMKKETRLPQDIAVEGSERPVNKR